MREDIQETVQRIKQSEDFFQKAKLIQYLQTEKKVTTKNLSEALEIQPAYLCHITRLNKLPELVVDGYYSQLISVSHLFIIARLNDQEQMAKVYEKVLSENLTVLQTEELIREYLYHVKTEGDHIPKNELDTSKERINYKFKNVETKIVQTRVKAKLILEVKGNLKKTSQVLKSLLDTLSE